MESSTSFNLIVSVKAQKEMAASWNWYEDRETGLGDRLIQEVTQKLNTIALNPELFSVKNNPYREARIAAFPYVVIYKIYRRKKMIEIVSVFHTSRNPKAKR